MSTRIPKNPPIDYQPPLAAVEQPAPTPNDGVAIWDLVIADMRERDLEGRARYGTPLQANNGRDALVDAYQEALDQVVYLRQAIEERRLRDEADRAALALATTASGQRRRHIACDLDGTLAAYDGWKGIWNIGAPVEPVVRRVKAALAAGHLVSIYTARVSGLGGDAEKAADFIRAWCRANVGQELPVTATKHGYFDEFWDDKAVRVRDGHAVLGGDLWAALGEDAQ